MKIEMPLRAWLLDGDPAIRWQVQRDLLNAKPTTWQRERNKVAEEGWGARLLARQDKKRHLGSRDLLPEVHLNTLHFACPQTSRPSTQTPPGT